MLYWIGRTLFYIFFKSVFRLKVSGRENLPRGGFIIATNHNSLLDPPLIGSALPRGVYFMAKKELFRNSWSGKIISMTHAIPIDRRAPGAQSIKEAIKILKAGKIMMVLPEGTRKNTGKIKYGIGLLAHKSGMPVVPARIVNNDKIKSFFRTGRTGRPGRPGKTNRSGRLIRPAQLKFKIKKPMYYPAEPGEPSSKKDYKLYAESVMEKIYN